jgi:hypothetical protein
MGTLCGCIGRLYQQSCNLLGLHTWMSKRLASSYLLSTYVTSHAAHVKETILCCIVFMIEDEDKNYVGTFFMIVSGHRNQNVIFFLVVLFTSWEALTPSKTNWPETLFLTTNRKSCRCVCNLRFKCFSCIRSEHHWMLRTMSVPKNISTQLKHSVHPGFFAGCNLLALLSASNIHTTQLCPKASFSLKRPRKALWSLLVACAQQHPIKENNKHKPKTHKPFVRSY